LELRLRYGIRAVEQDMVAIDACGQDNNNPSSGVNMMGKEEL